MNTASIPVGISDFTKVRAQGSYYIDKTGLIKQLLDARGTEIMLFTRPRRFGKTMAVSMLAEFFDIQKDSRSLFEGLEISHEKKLCAEWQNQFPVLYLTLKDVGGLAFDTAYGQLAYELAGLCRDHAYLGRDETLDIQERQQFLQLKAGEAGSTEVRNALRFLMKLMHAHYGRKVILLLDEYDVPAAKAESGHYYAEMMDVMRTMFSTALKDNPHLQFAVLTGCLRIAKESIFTGANHFVVNTVSDKGFRQFFGFTQKEVEQLLADMECEGHAEIIRQWYDGYNFGGMDMYCPWDVLNYVKKLKAGQLQKPENFWEHTSDNAVIGRFLSRTGFSAEEKFETLLNGAYIKERISENLTYDVMESSESNLWSLLYMTGYLTRVHKKELLSDDCLLEGETALRIPNEEVKDIFRKSVAEWFEKKAAGSDRRTLFAALWNADMDKLTGILSDLLFDTISYFDYRESFYHAFLTGLFSSAGYAVESNYENGLGRTDLVIKDRGNRRAAVVEAKTAGSQSTLEQECRKALAQIERNQYARRVQRQGYQKVLCIGIAFYKKMCLAKAESETMGSCLK